MSEDSGVRFRLPVRSILSDTFRIPFQHAGAFFKPLVLPGLALVVLTLGWQLTHGQMSVAVGWLLYAIYGVIFTIFAINCHRVVLLGPSPDTLAPKLVWGLRESRFLGWVILLAIVLAAGRLLFIVVLLNAESLLSFVLTSRSRLGLTWLKWSEFLSYGPVAYVVARLSLVLPATAIESKTSLRSAWKGSARNGWRLVLIVGALPWVLSRAVDLMVRQDATSPELVALTMLSIIASMLGIIALSLSYQDLSSGQA
jgi:hypothetical protein